MKNFPRGSCLVLFMVMWLLFGVSGNAQEPPVKADQAIRVNVARVNVGVVVTDDKGKFVEGLRRDAFHVFDNGGEHPITEFAPIEDPGQVLLLVEAGPAAYFLQDANLFAADAMMKGLSAGDRVAVARYTDSPLGLLDFTTDKGAAQAALSSIRFNLGFADLNLSSSLSGVLDWLERVPGKKTIVLISTGVDTSPESTAAVLQARLQVGDVRILCVSTSGPLRNGKQGSKVKIQQTQDEFAAADRRLRAIAELTGGRAYFPLNGKAFQETYKEVAEIVRHEYSLAFALPAADGAVHSIDVKVDRSSVAGKSAPAAYRVNHRKGYQAPKE
ncbi:MAG TPA: VWA domain-containing protein [Candidatus Acidoferrales bacterium]|nr:VWA domain-containing protein [Candidatus Acidoferrales bacterium]